MMNFFFKIVLAVASCLKQDGNQSASRGKWLLLLVMMVMVISDDDGDQ